ncbi:hypothetical protein IU427_08080 [Nocardia beijingensis]|uniref:hypothetical protein n=1 Tax=Nocardia beijingensis TaxID=95162 RepID=UPI001895F45C|nr:hypothetical protein [Nocardia beijingensis]MBF6465144.1 hypothetical protein [Nocardia beijingensis]
MPAALARRREPFAQGDPLGHVHAQPPHAPVVAPLELGAQPGGEFDDGAARMRRQPGPHRLVETQ